jgi:hypothetical protein
MSLEHRLLGFALKALVSSIRSAVCNLNSGFLIFHLILKLLSRFKEICFNNLKDAREVVFELSPELSIFL